MGHLPKRKKAIEPDTVPFGFEDLQRGFAEERLTTGRQYFDSGRVLDIWPSQDGRSISGRIKGSRQIAYEPQIHLLGEPGTVEIVGMCNCGTGFNCHHAAALLVAVLARAEGHEREQATPGEGLSLRLHRWLEDVEAAEREPGDEAEQPEGVEERLFYVLRLTRAHGSAPEITVRAVPAFFDANDALHAATATFHPRMVNDGEPPRFIRESDRRILKTLLGFQRPGQEEADHQILEGEEGYQLLQAMIATGRAVFGELSGVRLVAGAARRARLRWAQSRDGTQRLVFEVDGDTRRVLPVLPTCYLDGQTGEVGVVELDLPDRLTTAMALTPLVPPQQSARLREEMEKRGLEGRVPLPKAYEDAERKNVEPIPQLHLFLAEMAQSSASAQALGEVESVPLARLAFDYEGSRIRHHDNRSELTRLEEGELKIYPRDRGFEQRAKGRLTGQGFLPASEVQRYDLDSEFEKDFILLPHDPKLHGLVPESELMRFVHQEVPKLREEGWHVEVDAEFPYRQASQADSWVAEVDEGSGIDWFALELGVEIDGERINLLPLLTAILERFDHRFKLEDLDRMADSEILYAPLGDGQFLPMPLGRLRPMLHAIKEMYRTQGLDEDGRLTLPNIRAGELAGMEESTRQAGFEWRGGERIREMGQRMRNFSGIAETDPPEGFRDILRPYQKHGLDWLQFLREHGFGGVLADDMGLGKTIQTLAHIVAEKQAGRMDGPVLVVAPTSLMGNWRHEAGKFAPELSVLTLHGAERHDWFDQVERHDLVLTTYPLLVRDKERLLNKQFYMVVLDEAQMIKNPKAGTTQAAHKLKARHKLALTGTPMENHLGELWSIFQFLMPGFLGDSHSFRQTFRQPIEKQGDEDRRAHLASRIRPFLLRRTKSQVMRELPEKIEMAERIELDGDQRDLYETVRVSMEDKVKTAVSKRGMGASHIVILDALLKLRQICCDPRLMRSQNSREAPESAKLQRLMEMLPEMIEEGRKILLFSQFTSMLALIEEELIELGIDYAKLTGNTKDRDGQVQRFQDGEVPLFLISLKAGGTGLNLTAADTVIHYDPWWNPAVENQATDRAHRIGQDKSVFVYRLMTCGTVEEKIQAMQDYKRELAEGVYERKSDGESSSPQFTEKDLQTLLAPIE